MDKSEIIKHRHFLQWLLAPVVVITIALGYWYPWLGFSVPVVMLAGVIGGVINGRVVCGNYCPRGSFLDRLITPLSMKRKIPDSFFSLKLRLPLFGVLMGFMAWRVSLNPGSLMHWGHVFWLMCVITTAIAVVLGIIYSPRAWCAFCPMGTMQRLMGGNRKQLLIDSESCTECGACGRVCPFGLDIKSHREKGIIAEPDCLRCMECGAVCPRESIENCKHTEPAA